MANAKISNNFVREYILDVWQIGRHSFGHVFDLSELSRLRKKFAECVHACEIVHRLHAMNLDISAKFWCFCKILESIQQRAMVQLKTVTYLIFVTDPTDISV